MRDPISDKKTKEPSAQCANPRDFSAFVARRTNNFRLSHTNIAAATIVRNAMARHRIARILRPSPRIPIALCNAGRR
ncbi:hypothetical protein J5T34_10755 [Cupriavidus gilardii]|uniref:hypothetical protein n=1 Tax=Cupriavidus gilardii TaxID=82541 RepID=UPI001ABE44E8|nr:hypothetical protein [Cupriavidus gilardii]MBO4121201.1 hypothetical protein [Cupriavidus gilardii]